MDKNYKLLVPTYLILLDMVLTILLIVTSILNQKTVFFVISFTIIVSYYISQYCNFKWKITSRKFNWLSLMESKLFTLSFVGCLLFEYKIFVILFILEIISIILYVIKFRQTHKIDYLKMEKWQFILLIIIDILLFGKANIQLVYGFSYVIINLDILSIVYFILDYIYYQKPSIEENTMHQEIMNDSTLDNLEDTIVLEDIKELENKIDDNEKN